MIYDVRDSFLDAAHELPKEIGRKVWKCLRSLSRSPSASGLNLERLSGKAARFWSMRVDDKHRAILQRDDKVTTLLFVGTHDDAYRFAERAPRADGTAVGPCELPIADEWPAATPTATVSQRRHALRESRTAKYVPLARYLLNTAATSESATLSFSEIEETLGVDLPASARRHRAWWGNDMSGGHVQATAWLSVGWRVAKVSLSGAQVTFELDEHED